MSEPESAHGKLSPIDQQWTGIRFVVLIAVTLTIALIIIFVIAGLKSGDFSYAPFAHDVVRHTLESSAL